MKTGEEVVKKEMRDGESKKAVVCWHKLIVT